MYKRITTKDNFGDIETICDNCELSKQRNTCTFSFCNERVWQRLAELEDKIENGTLIELPCKVGTKVFYIQRDYNDDGILYYGQMDYNDDGILYYDIEEVEFDMWCMMYWGKWIFLTKSQAEEKLKELQNEKN